MNGVLVLIGDAACSPELLTIVRIIRNGVLPIFQIGIPILLILMGSIDLGKAVISSDDKAIKESTSKLIKRCIAAIAIFFIVTIVTLLTSIVTNNAGDENINASEWASCWEAAAK